MLTRLRAVASLFMVTVALIVLTAATSRADTLNGHTVVLDSGGSIIPWTADPAAGYDQVVKLAWNYLLHAVPNDSINGKPAYYSHSYLNPDTQVPVDWPHNPAGLYAMLVESALKYYAYSGDSAPVALAQNVAVALLDNGMTPNGWNWGNVPYASGDSGSLTYQGAALGNTTGRGDGTGVIEPDKVGEMGYAWLQLYRYDGNTRFRDAAIAAADALVAHLRTGTATQSPWPFRVYAQTGVIREDYCANVLGPISLFDGLIALGLGNTASYQSGRQTAWTWLMTYPMQNRVWANYFEDVPIQPDLGNVTSYNALMVARYLLDHPEYDLTWESDVRGLLGWVESNFGVSSYGANTITIAEQIQFWYPMGSHTSRYGAVNSLLYEKTGDLAAKEKGYRALNWATYMARSNGVVIDGPSVGNQWFTDGYGDYIRHFLTSFGAVPEWAPSGQNHLLRSGSVVQNVSYAPLSISYTTADPSSVEVLRVITLPGAVTVDGVPLAQGIDLTQPGWTYDPALKILRIRHDTGRNVRIAFSLSSLAVVPNNQSISIGATLQFTAIGTFTDGSTLDLTSIASWGTSDGAVASIGNAGLATALSAGTTSITASVGSVSDTTSLTVLAAPLTVTTSALPAGTLNAAYSATLSAAGGVPSYTWSISGALPSGLTLNGTTGVISGTPTVSGTSTFSVTVTDSGTPQQSATKSLSIAVAAPANYSIWSPSTMPGVADAGPDSAVELGVKFRSDSAGYIVGIRFFKGVGNTGTHVANLWNGSGTRLATANFSGETATGWQQANFSSPVAISANTVYVASYHTNVGHYSDDQNYFLNRGIDAPPLHALADGASGANGVYAYGSGSSFPNVGWRSSNYWVDVVFSTAGPLDTTAPTVTAFSIPSTTATLNVPVTTFTATDNVGVTGYLLTESAVAPPPTASGWMSTPPGSYLFATPGSKTLYAWARDAAGNVSSSRSASVLIDTSRPNVTGFTVPASATTLTVAIVTFTATDNVAVTGYLVTESSLAPVAGAAGWSATPPASYSFASGGNKTLYAWAKDGVGNVSASLSASVTVTVPDTTAPTVTAFTVAATSATLTVPIATFTASDNVGVTGYLVNESATPPASSAPGWSATPPASYTFAIQGSKTLYAWAEDAAGNVSASRSASVSVDTAPPAAPTGLTATAAGPTVVNLLWSAGTDNVGVVGYRIFRNGTQIGSGTTTSYTDSGAAAAITYSYTVRALDAAGNVSVDSNSASVTTPAASPAPVLDVSVTTKQSTASRTIVSPSFSTTRTNELLVAFITSDGPSTGGSQRISTVTGGGVTWTLRARANARAGTAEIWTAAAPALLSNVTVTATRATGSYQGMITIAAFQGASLTVNGAAATASAATGAPSVTLTTTRANSLVWGTGDDWDRAVARSVGSGQSELSEFLAPAGDTFWVQYRTAPTAAAGTAATISCTAPTNDRWNLAAIEIVPQ